MLQVVPSKFEENLDKKLKSGSEYARETAACKAKQVYEELLAQGQDPDLVIGADTVVEYDNLILEKPLDDEDARRTLKILRGTRHAVHTGVALISLLNRKDVNYHSFTETTWVQFNDFTDADIEHYIESGEPFGKAGSYGIQGKAAAFTERIDGCFYNVVGFPISRFCSELGGL
jgi:septum formation protein